MRPLAYAAAVAVVAALAGHAIAGGFSNESSAGQAVSSKVMWAWASGNTSAIDAIYAPNVKVVLEYPGRPASEVDTTRTALTNTIMTAKGIGNTYTQIGPVTSYRPPTGTPTPRAWSR